MAFIAVGEKKRIEWMWNKNRILISWMTHILVVECLLSHLSQSLKNVENTVLFVWYVIKIDWFFVDCQLWLLLFLVSVDSIQISYFLTKNQNWTVVSNFHLRLFFSFALPIGMPHFACIVWIFYANCHSSIRHSFIWIDAVDLIPILHWSLSIYVNIFKFSQF